MSISRGTLRNDVLKQADALGSGRWDATAGGEVDRRISSVYDRIWRRILNANRFYRVSARTPTSDAVTGKYLMADLTIASGDSAQRLYRILQVLVDNRVYTEGKLTDWALAAQTGIGYLWYQEGLNLTALPLQTGKVADAIWVNWLPQRPSALSGDSVLVDFPDGYEEVLIVLAASRLLMKGGAETQASRELRTDIEEDYQELLQDVSRVSTNPLMATPLDNAMEWGGF